MSKTSLSTLVVALALLFSATVHAQEKRPPNVVLIMADDMGYECVGANGCTSYRTPALDRLAKEGTRFTNAHSQPLCTPSRVQIMTGLYNSRNYIRFGILDPKATTIGHHFKRAGYATCIVGKWQLRGGLEGPRHFGFDSYCLWQLDRRPGRYPNPGLEIDGRRVDYHDGEYGPDLVTDHLSKFIEKNKERPFFAYYPMILPHWPFEPTPDSADWDPKSKGMLKGKGKPRYFKGMVEYTDKMVGKVVARLDALGLRKNTLVMFTCDNGTAVGVQTETKAGVVAGGKGKTTKAGTHVPFIVSWPGVVKAGAVCEDLVDFTDVLPTVAELAGFKLPPATPLDGRSFAPQLRGAKGNPRRWIYCWYYRNGKIGKNNPGRGEFALNHRYKYYRDGRFFDLGNDPLEERPVADAQLTAEGKAAREELRGVVERYKR